MPGSSCPCSGITLVAKIGPWCRVRVLCTAVKWHAASAGVMLSILCGAVHRARADGSDLLILEVQHGDDPREDDIERLQEFVAGYEARIAVLERQLKQLLEDRSNPQAELPPADQ